jgi:hypothetical protein
MGVLGANEILAILVAVARLVAPGFSGAPSERIEPLISDYELRARRAIDRRRRRALEDLEGPMTNASAIDEAELADVVARTEARAAFLLSGDLRASVEALAAADPALANVTHAAGPAALGRVLGQPISRDLVAFALSSDATALRRSLGTLWS